jgi:hypothetical protein
MNDIKEMDKSEKERIKNVKNMEKYSSEDDKKSSIN